MEKKKTFYVMNCFAFFVYSGEADWIGNGIDFKVSVVFSPAVLCGVSEEKITFTPDNSLSHFHYRSAFVAFSAFICCVSIVIFTYEVLNSTNSSA